MRPPALLPALALLAALAPRAAHASLFSDWLEQHPDRVFSASCSSDTRRAVSEYQSRSGYAASLRSLTIAGLTAGQLDRLLLSKGFERHDDWIRDPSTHELKLDAAGRPMRMLVYTHADGGMVRVKPDGEPTSRFRPQPHAVKSARWPPDADYRDFTKKAFKVDGRGRALPKWPADLYNPYADTALKSTFEDGWGDTVHVNLVPVPAPAPSGKP
jgi:hypothetical protein